MRRGERKGRGGGRGVGGVRAFVLDFPFKPLEFSRDQAAFRCSRGAVFGLAAGGTAGG